MRTAAAILTFALFAAVAHAGSAFVGKDKLALMPLPRQELGSGAVGLPLDHDSGIVTNADAADDATGPNVTAATLAHLGRVTGYTLDYDDSAAAALRTGKGLIEVRTTVESYAGAAQARAGFAFWRSDDVKVARLKLNGVELSVHTIPVARLGDASYGLGLVARPAGKKPFYSTHVVFRTGTLVALTDVSGAEPDSVRRLAVSLAPKLARRIAGVLHGTIKGPPVPLPGALKAGPPPHGPGLDTLTLRVSDVGAGRVTSQGYRLDKDLSPVSEYSRELTPGGHFVFLSDQVALFHSPTEATYAVSFLAGAMDSGSLVAAEAGGSIRSFTPRAVTVRAGDESRAVIANVVRSDGLRLQLGFVLVRVGAITSFVSVGNPEASPIQPSQLVALGKLAARRITAGLHK